MCLTYLFRSFFSSGDRFCEEDWAFNKSSILAADSSSSISTEGISALISSYCSSFLFYADILLILKIKFLLVSQEPSIIKTKLIYKQENTMPNYGDSKYWDQRYKDH